MKRYKFSLPHQVYYLAAATLANSLGTFLLPFLPLYLKSLGNTEDVIGLTIACYGIGCLLSSLSAGWISDRIGRKPIIYVNLLISSALTGCIGFVANTVTLIIIVFAIGCCAGMSRPASTALVGDIVSEEMTAAAYGLLYWAGNAGFIIASLLGGFIATKSFLLLFLLDSATCMTALILLFYGLSSLHELPSVEKTSTKHSETSRRVTPLLFVILIAFFSWMVQTQAWTALPLTVNRYGYSAFDWGILSAINGAVVIICQPWVNVLVKNWGTTLSLGIGCLILGIGFSLTMALATLMAFILQTIFWSIGEILVATAGPAAVSQLTTSANRGRWMGYLAAAFSLASCTSSGGCERGGW
ncbi:MFS transporter [Actinomyces capricornis]|uniref:MFS transporter n=1 Tax=Actinomyces capricornis TaxID=2755559 RepID=UPI001CC70301